MKFLAVLFLVVFCVSSQATDLQVGNSLNGVLVYVENVQLSAIPLTSRIKNVFYNDSSNRNIRGITALDRDQSNTTVIITSGGVGSSFVNLRIRGVRGSRVYYQVQVFI